MRLGILDADILDAQVQDQYTNYAQMVRRLIGEEGSIDYAEFSVINGQLPADVDQCDAYLITGSQYSAYDTEPWIKNLLDFVQRAYQSGKKLIGICFGHQIIAKALGASVRKSERGWGVGVHEYRVSGLADWMPAARKRVCFRASHQDQVEELPAKAKLLLSSEFCPVAGFIIDKQVLSLQGHPEFDRQYMQYLIEKRKQSFGKKIYTQAKASLEQPVDNRLAAQWFRKFLLDSK